MNKEEIKVGDEVLVRGRVTATDEGEHFCIEVKFPEGLFEYFGESRAYDVFRPCDIFPAPDSEPEAESPDESEPTFSDEIPF